MAWQPVVVGDSRLQVVIGCADGQLRELEFRLDGHVLPGAWGVPWRLETDRGVLLPTGGVSVERTEHGARLTGRTGDLDWNLTYAITGPGRITKTLELIPTQDLALDRVSLWNLAGSSPPKVASTPLQDIAAFHRAGGTSLFASLDFPYSKITCEGGVTSVAYPPHAQLKSGKSYTCHSLTFGAATLTGHERYGFDEGEVDAMDSYVQQRFPPRFDRPMFVTSCIVNRYTQVRGDIIWYTMHDHPTFSYNQDIMKRELDLMKRLGMEYYQLFTGPFDSVPGDPEPETVDEIVRYAKSRGIRIGDYSSVATLFCGHYNEYRNTVDNHPEWGLRQGDLCLGNRRFVDFYISQVVGNCKRYGYELHILDFLNIQPCLAQDHGHEPGEDSVYAQVEGLTRLLSAINEVSPEMLAWSNAGNWADFLPKLAWTNPNLYLTDPYVAAPWQGLNMTRLLDDVRREQMVSLHNSRFVPYRFFTNAQYFFCANSIVPDIRNYEYGALSTIAVTPNLSLCEIRPWMDRLSATDKRRVTAFYKHWTGFLNKHYDLWTKTCQAGDNPGPGSVEIYSHAKGNRGYVFLVNPNYWGRTVEVPLDTSMGFDGDGRCEVVELYPVRKTRLTAQGPFVTLGSKLPVHVPAQQVIVLEIKPAPVTIHKPRLYGLPGTIEPTDHGYLIKTRGDQGTTHRCAVLLPKGSEPIRSVNVLDVPKQPKRLWAPTPVELLAQDESGVLLEVTFRRTPAPTELRDWRVRPGTVTEGIEANWTSGLPDAEPLAFPLFCDVEGSQDRYPMWDEAANRLGLGPLANFCGGYVDNAFSESQETWIELRTDGEAEIPDGELVSGEQMPALRPLSPSATDPRNCWWLETDFHLPFMYTLGFEPAFDEHTILALPTIRQSKLTQIKAWINGQPLEVRAYRYPRNRALACYYADLVGAAAHGGENKLVVYFESAL